MKYISTRGLNEGLDTQDAILQGISRVFFIFSISLSERFESLKSVYKFFFFILFNANVYYHNF